MSKQIEISCEQCGFYEANLDEVVFHCDCKKASVENLDKAIEAADNKIRLTSNSN